MPSSTIGLSQDVQHIQRRKHLEKLLNFHVLYCYQCYDGTKMLVLYVCN